MGGCVNGWEVAGGWFPVAGEGLAQADNQQPATSN
jgi:hypothetical protein